MALRLTKSDTGKVEAFAIANDIRRFDLLIEDLDNVLEKSWSPLSFEDGLAAYAKDPYDELEFVIVAVDRADEANLGPAANIIKTAKSLGLRVLLVAHELSPVALHQLMRLGADDFAPYPLPEGALADSFDRLRAKPAEPAEDQTGGGGKNRNGMILPVYGLAGGVGASTFAVNLAWEMALYTKKTNKRILLVDLDFQYGTVSTYLDLARREGIYELLTDAANVDTEALSSALTSFKTRLAVLTAPSDALPARHRGAGRDGAAPEDRDAFLRLCHRRHADHPRQLV